MAVGFFEWLLIAVIVDMVEFVALFWSATGGLPWSTSSSRKGKYLTISDYDENTGRFRGSLNFSINEVLGLADRAILQKLIEDREEEIRNLKKELSAYDGRKR